MKENRFLSYPVLGICAAAFLPGCEAVVIGAATPMIIKQERINLTNSSYAAVDILTQQSSHKLDRSKPLRLLPLEEIIVKPGKDMWGNQKPTPEFNPKLGRVLSEQMLARFIQLGYIEASLAHSRNGTSGWEPAPITASGYELGGTYQIINKVMHISLRLSDRDSGKILSAYDYNLPVTYDIRQHMHDGDATMAPLL